MSELHQPMQVPEGEWAVGDEPRVYALERDTWAEFFEAKGRWSEATFGSVAERGPIGPLKHLLKEVQECLDKPDDPMEYVDCLFLTVDAARRAGISTDRLLQLCWEKLAINQAREWGKPSADGPVEHVRE